MDLAKVIRDERVKALRELTARIQVKCQELMEEAEAMSLGIVKNDEEAQRRKLRLEGRAQGIRAVAGFVGEIIKEGQVRADHANAQS